MGLFSTVYNSCDLFGPDFLGDLQTKDLECLMDYYWISPRGELFKVDGYGVFDEGSPGGGFRRLRTSCNVVLRPYYTTALVRLYGMKQSDFIETAGFFKLGKLTQVIPVKELTHGM